MKKTPGFLITMLFLISIVPLQLKAGTESDLFLPDSTQTVQTTEMTQLTNRLNEIKEMDKSALTSPERKALRKEVRSIKETMAELNGGVYISVGAAILIVLLLILLL